MRKRVEKRYWWLIKLVTQNGFTTGAEIGCAAGATTGRLLRFCPALKLLYAVDKWEHIPEGSEAGEMGAVYGTSGCENWDPVRGLNRFHKVTDRYKDRLVILRGDSAGMASEVPDESLDFVFIDADHRYAAVLRDLVAWIPKVRPGGMITGHDIHLPGVLKAVSETLPGYAKAGVDHVWFIQNFKRVKS